MIKKTFISLKREYILICLALLFMFSLQACTINRKSTVIGELATVEGTVTDRAMISSRKIYDDT